MKTFHEFLERYKNNSKKKITTLLGKVNGVQFRFFCGYEDNDSLQNIEGRLEKANIRLNTLTEQFEYISNYIKFQTYPIIVYYLNFKQSEFKVFIRYFIKEKIAEIITILPSHKLEKQESCYDELMNHFEEIGWSFENNSVDIMRAGKSVSLVMFEKENGKYDIYGDICIDDIEL